MVMRLLILLPNVLLGAYMASELSRNWLPDLFIYREGARLGWQGVSPYSPRIADAVRGEYPGDEKLIRNCGYFLPPQAVIVMGPFAALPWQTAKLCYAVLCLVSVACCWYGLTFAFRDVTAPVLEKVPVILPWLVCLHPVLWMTFDVGQTTILAAGAVSAGQLLHERGWRWLGALLWACAFVKPHIALPLLPLAWYLGGMKRAALLVAWLGLLNLAGCLIVAGTPLFAFEYLKHLAENHKEVIFNRVANNPQITSWNCIVTRSGGPEIELTLATTLLGYSLFYALAVMRCVVARRWPSSAWALAVSMTAAMVCCQVLAYEAWLLVLVVPFILECFDRGRKLDGVVIAGLLVLQMIPLATMIEFGMLSFRPWLIAALALWLLARYDPVAKERITHSPSPASGP